MKFFTLFAAAASAATIAQRDLATIQAAIQSISDGTSALQTQVNGFQGAGQVASLQQASQSLISTIGQATQQVAGTSDLTGPESIQLIDPINALSALVSSTVDATIAKKPTFVSAGVGSVVYDQLVQIRDASARFSSTVIGKVPQALQQTAQNLAAPISQNLDRAVAAFADQQNGGGSSSSSSMSSSSMSSSSSAPATTSSGSIPVYPYPTASTYPTASGSVPAYPTESAPGYPAPSSSPIYSVPGYNPPAANGTYTATFPQYTGAAAQVATGYGVAAVAALAAIVAF